jgi:plasmid stabilization system protein ParE
MADLAANRYASHERESQGAEAPMARIELAPEVLDDFDRIFDHIANFNVDSAPQRIEEITKAIDILETSPLIGRPVRSGATRELIIGRATHAYVALYRYLPDIDTVFVLAIRAQRESGYKHRVKP